MSPINLNLGCGTQRIEGYIGVDRIASTHVDVVADLEKGYLPFRDSVISNINAAHILEHIANLPRLIDELHRVMERDGELFVKVPHFSSVYAWTDPTHVRAFTSRTLDYFCANPGIKQPVYFEPKFLIINKRLRYSMNPYKRSNILLNKLVFLVLLMDKFANFAPDLCERLWCYWVGGFEELEISIKAI